MAVNRSYTSLSKLYMKTSTGEIKSFAPNVSPNPNGTQYKGLNTPGLDAAWGLFGFNQVYSEIRYGKNNTAVTYTMPEYNNNYIGIKMDFGGYGTKVQYFFKLKFEGTDFLSLDQAHSQGLIDDVCLTISNNHTSYPISNTDNWYAGTYIGLSGYPTHKAVFRPTKKLLQIQYRYYASNIFSGGTSTSSADGVYIYTSSIKEMNTDGIFEVEYNKVSKFEYTGSEQSYVVPADGTYKIQCWGAYNKSRNFTSDTNRACGGYTHGEIELKRGETLYVYVGASGQSFNYGTHAYQNDAGGATDVRLTNGTWNNTTSLRSRIMVAGGAGTSGGLNSWNSGTPYGGSGGGLSGKAGGAVNTGAGGAGGTQTSGYSFGVAATSSGGPGGNGYYSGRSGYASNGVAGGGGGSSFISGHAGCNAINSSGSHTGSPNHYSGKIFTKTVMIDGDSSMPLPNGKTGKGHEGNGVCIITGPLKADKPNLKCKIDNTIKDIKSIECKVNNEWKKVTDVYIKQDNVWKSAVQKDLTPVELIPVMSSNTCSEGTISAGYAGGATYNNSLKIGYPWYVTHPNGEVNGMRYQIKRMSFTNATSLTQNDAWWQYTFTNPVKITRLEGEASRWAESNKGNTESYDVYISTDGSTFTKHGTWTKTGITWKEQNGNGTGLIQMSYDFGTPVTIKAFKLQALSHSSDTWPSNLYFAMYKIQAYGHK